MINTSAAGHAFVNGYCACGRKWVDIMNCGRADIGQGGIAHAGLLNAVEADQIIALKAKQDQAISNAFGWREKDKAA